MTEQRTNPVPGNAVHVQLPPVQVRGFDKLFATLSEAFDEPDYGGAFDGVSVTSDADPGL